MGLKIDTGMKIVLYSKLIIFKSLWDWKAPGEATRLALLLCFLPASDEIFTRGLLNRRARALQIWRAGGNKTAAERQNDWAPNESEANDGDGIIM